MRKILIGVVAVVMIGGFFLLSRQNTEIIALNDSTAEINDEASTSKTKVVEMPENDSDSNSNDDVVVLVTSDKTIDMSGKGLTNVPGSVFEKISIQKLDLSNNNLGGSLQAEVRHLQALKILDLSNNKYTGVPAEIGQLKNLEELNLSNNQITGLPHELGGLSRLKVLNLKGNDYSADDLEIIKKDLPVGVQIEVD